MAVSFRVPRYHRYHPWERSGGGDEVARFHTLPLYTSIFIFKWYLVPLSTKRRVTDVKPRVPLRRSKWYQVVPSGTEEGGVGRLQYDRVVVMRWGGMVM